MVPLAAIFQTLAGLLAIAIVLGFFAYGYTHGLFRSILVGMQALVALPHSSVIARESVCAGAAGPTRRHGPQLPCCAAVYAHMRIAWILVVRSSS